MNYLNKNKNKYYVIKKNSTLVLLNKDNELIGSYGALNDTVFHKSQFIQTSMCNCCCFKEVSLFSTKYDYYIQTELENVYKTNSMKGVC